MRVIIIEDEKPAADKLKNALIKCNSDVQVAGVLKSIHEAVNWFTGNPMPDLDFYGY